MTERTRRIVKGSECSKHLHRDISEGGHRVSPFSPCSVPTAQRNSVNVTACSTIPVVDVVSQFDIPRQLTVVVAIVVLTVKRGYNDCVPAPPSFDHDA